MIVKTKNNYKRRTKMKLTMTYATQYKNWFSPEIQHNVLIHTRNEWHVQSSSQTIIRSPSYGQKNTWQSVPNRTTVAKKLKKFLGRSLKCIAIHKHKCNNIFCPSIQCNIMSFTKEVISSGLKHNFVFRQTLSTHCGIVAALSQ